MRGSAVVQLSPESPAELRAHVQSCNLKACGCRLLGCHLTKWQKETPVVDDAILRKLSELSADVSVLEKAQAMLASGESWLCWHVSKDDFFFAGCKFCKEDHGMQFCEKPQLKTFKLQRHAQNVGHIEAVCKVLGVAVPPKEVPHVAPGAQQFKDALEHLQKGHTGTLSDVGARGKMGRMEFALVEAARVQWRDRVREAVSLTLLRDERHKRLLLRFRATDDEMQVTEGVFGQLKGTYNSTALGIAEATLKILTKFCTPGIGDPEASKREAADCDRKLLEHIRLHVHCTTVDSASNEVTAAQDTAAPLEVPMADLQTGDVIFPNHKLIVRDRAHGTRRVLQRPWRADPFLEAVVVSLIHGPSSITQLRG